MKVRRFVALGWLSSVLRLRGLAAPALAAGCIASPPPPQTADEYAANAKRAYEEALETFHAKNWELVAPRMEDVKRNYGYSRYARLAELRIADAAFHQESFAEAVTGYRAFVHDYPNDPEVPYARYRITRCQFLSSGDSLILPPLEERDLSSVKDAYQSISAFIADYPHYKKRAELDYMLAVVAGMMVRYELYVARYYLDRGQFDAAIARCEYALQNYQSTGLEAEARVLLGETYMKMKKQADARHQFNQVLTKHPDSAFVVPARRFLAQLGEPIAKKRIP
jgi:outer membrane protein assembly factor BamD